MSMLFCHDGPIEKDEYGNFYSIGFNDQVFKNYDVLDDKISIAMRVHRTKKNDLKNNFLPLTKEKYQIIECPNLASIKGVLVNKTKCKKILKSQILKNDIMVIRLPSHIGNVACKIANKYKKDYIVELVGCPWDSLRNHSLIGKIIAPFLFFKTKYFVKKAKNVIYVTESFLQKRYPNMNNTIGCSDVIIEENNNEVLNRRISKINSYDEKIVLGTIGVIDIKYKGQEYVIKAIGKLLKAGINNVEYQLVGPGNQKRLKNVAKKYNVEDKISFIGTLTHNEIFKWLDNIDIYVQPSNTEGLPRSVIEAMSRACPCIGSKVGGIPELIDKDFLFEKKRVEKIAKLIIRVIEDKEWCIMSAKTNYTNSKKYSKKFLYEKKRRFYENFRKEIKINEK